MPLRSSPLASGVTRAAAAAVLLALVATVPAAVAGGEDAPELTARVLLGVPALAALLFDVAGGIIAAALATAAYAALRAAAGQIPGGGRTAALVLTWAIAFLVAGVALGYAGRTWRASEKAAARALVEPATGLFNIDYFVLETDAELARAKRYGRSFSVTLLDLPAAPIDALRRRARTAVLDELGRHLRDSVRSTDRVVITSDRTSYRLAVILPETSTEGARVFAARMADRVSAFLLVQNVGIPLPSPVVATVPGDEAKFSTLRAEFLGVARRPRPGPT